MKEHISRYGAITACMIVYQDFFSYSSGVYRHVSGGVAGGHCVSLIGWNDSLGCWIAKNSWGSGWGESGFFCIAYGESFIEDYPGSRPTVFGVSSVNIRAWLPASVPQLLYASEHPDNMWAYLKDFGWVRLAGGSQVSTAKLSELAPRRSAAPTCTRLSTTGCSRSSTSAEKEDKMPRSTKSVVETPMEAPLPKTNGSPETSPRPIESLTQTIQDTGGDALAAPAPTLIPSEIGTAIATGWAYNQQVSWLWTNSSPRNAYAYVNGTGWRRVGGASDAGHDAITLLASVARASGKPIHLYENADTTIGAAYL